MNREEFKLSVIKQIKEDNELMSSLLYRNDMVGAFNKSRYLLEREFYIRDFGMSFILSATGDDINEPRVSVIFNDTRELPAHRVGGKELGVGWVSDSFHVEVIEVTNHDITFSVTEVSLGLDKNYQFFIRHQVGHQDSLVFDLVDKTFVGNPVEAMEQWYSYRCNRRYPYVDFRMNQSFYDEFVKVISRTNFPMEDVTKIRNAFMHFSNPHKSTIPAMSNIVKMLIQDYGYKK